MRSLVFGLVDVQGKGPKHPNVRYLPETMATIKRIQHTLNSLWLQLYSLSLYIYIHFFTATDPNSDGTAHSYLRSAAA